MDFSFNAEHGESLASVSGMVDSSEELCLEISRESLARSSKTEGTLQNPFTVHSELLSLSRWVRVLL